MHDDLFGLVLTVSVIGFLCIVGHYKEKIRELKNEADRAHMLKEIEIRGLESKIRDLENRLYSSRRSSP